VIDKIGLPDPSFFIAADDVEYCLRANKYGIDTRVIVNSKIFHPPSNHYSFHFPFLKKIVILKLPPWKRYYDTRNRLLVAKKHYGLKWIYQTIPGSFLRLIGTLINEPGRINQLHAFMSGLIDGILGIKGKRHEWWRIKQ
jgi:GT2 family glycosyltransferase